MKKKKILLFLCLVLVIPIVFASDLPFVFDETKMDVGNMYKYAIQEMNGDKKMDFYFFIRSKDKVDCYVDFSSIIPQVFVVKADFDQKYCSFEKSYGYNPFSYMKINKSNDVSQYDYDFERKTVTLQMTYYGNDKKLKSHTIRKNLAAIPTYEMSLYQLDLWFAMRFRQNNFTSFTIGNLFNGSITPSVVTYQGQEEVNNVLCDKWQVSQKGILSSKKQFIWFDRTNPYYPVIKYTNTANVSPVGKLDINFVSVEKITEAEWDLFVEKMNNATKLKLGFTE